MSRHGFWTPVLIAILAFALGCDRSPKLEESTLIPSDRANNDLGMESEDGEVVKWEPDTGFRRLTMADFDLFGTTPESWSEIRDGFHVTGKPKGYWYTRESFGNVTVRLEYRLRRPVDLSDEPSFNGNTGFLFFITGEPKVWPMSVEVQGKYSEMATIKGNGGAENPVCKFNEAARDGARAPVGEWNGLEITARDGALTVKLNGELVNESEPVFLSEGAFGIQSEGFPFEIRRIQVRDDTMPATEASAGDQAKE